MNRFTNVLLPLAVAGVAALVFKPFYDWIRTRLRANKVVALLLVFLAVTIPVAGLVFFFGALVVDQMTGLIKTLPGVVDSRSTEWVKTNSPAMSTFLNENPYAQQLRTGMEGQTAGLISGLGIVGRQALSAGAGLITWIVGLMGWAVFPIYFSFFLMAETTSPKQPRAAFSPFSSPRPARTSSISSVSS